MVAASTAAATARAAWLGCWRARSTAPSRAETTSRAPWTPLWRPRDPLGPCRAGHVTSLDFVVEATLARARSAVGAWPGALAWEGGESWPRRPNLFAGCGFVPARLRGSRSWGGAVQLTA